MIPGPKPKPAEIAAAQGNPGHRPLATTPELPASAAIEAPQWLASKPEALAIWNAYTPRLRFLSFMRDTDVQAFARLCDHTARWLALRAKVDEKGESYVTESKHGTMERLNPSFVAMLRVEDKITALEDRFGLTPAARQQLLRAMRDGDGDAPPDLFGATPDAAQTKRPEAPSSPIGLMAPRAPSGGLN
jgi:P27 family predicted phage terminase small subunit